MADIPLIRNFDDGAVFAFRDRRPIRVEEFLAEAHRLAGLIPDRQYVVNLEGEVEIEVGDGTKRILRTGDILLAEDTTGQGHISRAVAGKPRKSLFITLD